MTMLLILLLSNHTIHGQEDCGIRTHLTTNSALDISGGVNVASADGSILTKWTDKNGGYSDVVISEWHQVTGQWQRSRLPLISSFRVTAIDTSTNRNMLVVGGQHYNPINFVFREMVWVLQRTIANGTQTWERVGAPIVDYPTRRYPLAGFGTAVTISANGSTIAVGARFYDNDRGRVQIYEKTTREGEWVQVGPAIVGATEQYGFGASLDLSDDGNILIVGEEFRYRDFPPQLTNATQARVYQRSNESPTVVKWNPMGSAIVSQERDRFFGRKVVISASGAIIAVAAQRRVGVYKFDSTLKQWKQIGSNLALENDTTNNLSMSADGNVVVVTDKRLVYSEGAGNVYAYTWEANQWKQLAIGSIVLERRVFYGIARISTNGKILTVSDRATSLYELNKNCNLSTCDPKWDMYDSSNDTLVSTLTSLNSVIEIPQLPSNTTNIEGIFPCGVVADTSVLMEVQKFDKTGIPQVYYSRNVKPVNGRYFLYGAGNGDSRILPSLNLLSGYMPLGKYTIRAKISGKYTARTLFVIR